MRILGIDPGYERLGIAVIEGERGKENYIWSECFKTSAKINFENRLFLIGEKIEKAIKKYHPDFLAIESIFFENNQKTAMRIAEVRGAIIFIAQKMNIKIAEYTPLQIKQAVAGFGRGNKVQVEIMTRKLIKIPNKKKLDDEIDALAVALTASASLGR